MNKHSRIYGLDCKELDSIPNQSLVELIERNYRGVDPGCQNPAWVFIPPGVQVGVV